MQGYFHIVFPLFTYQIYSRLPIMQVLLKFIRLSSNDFILLLHLKDLFITKSCSFPGLTSPPAGLLFFLTWSPFHLFNSSQTHDKRHLLGSVFNHNLPSVIFPPHENNSVLTASAIISVLLEPQMRNHDIFFDIFFPTTPTWNYQVPLVYPSKHT